MWVKATLIKRKTDDGFFEVQDHVPLGKIYMVDPSTIRVGKGYNMPHGAFWEKEIIVTDEGSYFPTELLDIERR